MMLQRRLHKQKAVFPGAEKNYWERLFTLSSKKKSIYITLQQWEKEKKKSKTMSNMATHCDNKNSSLTNVRNKHTANMAIHHTHCNSQTKKWSNNYHS